MQAASETATSEYMLTFRCCLKTKKKVKAEIPMTERRAGDSLPGQSWTSGREAHRDSDSQDGRRFSPRASHITRVSLLDSAAHAQYKRELQTLQEKCARSQQWDAPVRITAAVLGVPALLCTGGGGTLGPGSVLSQVGRVLTSLTSAGSAKNLTLPRGTLEV